MVFFYKIPPKTKSPVIKKTSQKKKPSTLKSSSLKSPVKKKMSAVNKKSFPVKKFTVTKKVPIKKKPTVVKKKDDTPLKNTTSISTSLKELPTTTTKTPALSIILSPPRTSSPKPSSSSDVFMAIQKCERAIEGAELVLQDDEVKNK